jgi:enoyl-CoA hydratase/carnithine racemase
MAALRRRQRQNAATAAILRSHGGESAARNKRYRGSARPALTLRSTPRKDDQMPLLYDKKGAVAVLTLSRPQARNAWGEDYNTGLAELLPRLEDDDEIRAVILTGDEAGGAFSAGADLKNPRTHTSDSIAAAITALPKRRRLQAMNLLSDFAKPIVAAVNGYAVGIGCIVTYCCDLIVASERAEWRLPQVGLGILPAQGGTVRLARWIGRGQAMKLALGFPLSGKEAYRTGLAQFLVPHAELMAQAMVVAEHVVDLPPLAARLAKESVAFGLDVPMREAANADLYRFMALELTEDKKEAHQAWRERRKPKVTGR